MDQLYRLTYRVDCHENGLSAEEVRAKDGDLGACDQIVIHSILTPSNGSSSTVIVSLDGNTGEPLSPDDLFRQWVLMAHHLLDELPEGRRRDLVKSVHEQVRNAVMRDRHD